MTARLFEVDRSYRFKKGSGMPVRIPVIEMVEIGAGGGSIGSIDQLGRIAVGPESAGSDPGPVAYGNGGLEPTVTDADLILGKITPDYFAGGAIALDEAGTIKAMEQRLGSKLSMDATQSAFGISEIVDENMASAARAHAVEQGNDIQAYSMAAFGGAAPLHAARLAEKLGIKSIVIPRGAGVGSAIGFLLAPASYEVVRSNPTAIANLNLADVLAMFSVMRGEAEAVVEAAIGEAPRSETRTAFMRYRGQGYEVPVFLTDDDMSIDALKTGFEKVYKEYYGRLIPDMEIEILTWALKISGPLPATDQPQNFGNENSSGNTVQRSAFDASIREVMDYTIHERATLPAGIVVEGPALIVEDQTTTVVTSAYNAIINEFGDIVLTRGQVK